MTSEQLERGNLLQKKQRQLNTFYGDIVRSEESNGYTPTLTIDAKEVKCSVFLDKDFLTRFASFIEDEIKLTHDEFQEL